MGKGKVYVLACPRCNGTADAPHYALKVWSRWLDTISGFTIVTARCRVCAVSWVLRVGQRHERQEDES